MPQAAQVAREQFHKAIVLPELGLLQAEEPVLAVARGPVLVQYARLVEQFVPAAWP